MREALSTLLILLASVGIAFVVGWWDIIVTALRYRLLIRSRPWVAYLIAIHVEFGSDLNKAERRVLLTLTGIGRKKKEK